MTAIRFEDVSKRYRVGPGSYGTLRDEVAAVFRKVVSRQPKEASPASINRDIWALRDVSFEVEQGEAFGIIGPNGAGKSTILKLLAGIAAPNQGHIHVHGRIAPLIELGAGFHPELTGRENVYINGVILGMSREEVRRRFDAIVAFAELEEFLDVPLKKYSSGMYARLGFSVAIHTEPDVLLVDEVLAVGDWAFHVKCFKLMKDFLHRGTTIVLVSHNMDAVSELCQQSVLLNSGRVEANGPTSEAIAKYYAVCSQHHINYKPDGTKVARIDRLELLGLSHEPRNTFHAGEMALLRYWVIFDDEVISPEFGFFVRGSDQTFLVSTGSRDLGVTMDRCASGSLYRVEFVFEVNLLEGVYHIGAEVRDRHFKNYYDFTEKAVTMIVHEKYSHGGWVHLNPQCRVEPELPEASGGT